MYLPVLSAGVMSSGIGSRVASQQLSAATVSPSSCTCTATCRDGYQASETASTCQVASQAVVHTCAGDSHGGIKTGPNCA